MRTLETRIEKANILSKLARLNAVSNENVKLSTTDPIPSSTGVTKELSLEERLLELINQFEKPIPKYRLRLTLNNLRWMHRNILIGRLLGHPDSGAASEAHGIVVALLVQGE